MPDVRKVKITNALAKCLRKEHGAPEGTETNPCLDCPYKDKDLCRETLLRDTYDFLMGIRTRFPVEIGFNIYGEDAPICPECDYELRPGFMYCPKCGTAIDWDDFIPFEDDYYDAAEDSDDYSEDSFA